MSAITPDTELRLLKCPIESDNMNQLTFANEQAQYNYFNSLPSITEEGFTYQRESSIIRFPAQYDDILEYNYVMYKNNHYSDKWFYAFITNMEYKGDGATWITIKTDVFQTWQFDLVYKNSFVEREHVNDDTVGKHTIPEGLETGEYVAHDSTATYFDDVCFLVNVSEYINGTKVLATPVNGIWMSGGFYVFDNINSLVTTIQAYAKEDVIKQVYIVPKFLLSVNSYNTQWAGKATPTYTSKSITKPTTIGTYTPVNKKLLTYPYVYLLETNNNGASATFKYELFDTTADFAIGGCATVGASISSVPSSYDGGDESNMLIAGKFPTCSWSEDAYTNWLTMNGVNVGGLELNAEEAGYALGASEALLGLAGLATGNPFAIATMAGGVGSVLETMKEAYRHKLVPDSFKGNINGGDFLTASGHNGFVFYKMGIKEEYAKIIDKYFSMYGYKVNDLKVPNITGRTNWNYVKTNGAIIEGNVPQKDLEEIKSLFNRGITFWHNPTTYLDYSQSNAIVS